MSVDVLQDKIRKRKNPIILDLTLSPDQIPPQLREGRSDAEAYGLFSRELIGCMKGILPGVRISFAAFALMGTEGISQLQQTLQAAKEAGLYVLLDAPEIFSPTVAQIAANTLLSNPSEFPCDGLVISGYLGSDAIRPFLPWCKNNKKSVFVLARTANKSAPELQDLIAGTRLVHLAAADYANRQGVSLIGKSGYSLVGCVAAATAPQSLQTLRGKYPSQFLLVEGLDYPGGNAKNCSFAFDKFGHGCAVCVGASICCAWQQEDASQDYLKAAMEAQSRILKNIVRYIAIL